MAKADMWMPLYIGDYRATTGRLTTEQHGAYLLLLMDYWKNGPAPDDDAVLASITLLPPERWHAHRPAIAAFFQIQDGQWRQKRVEAEIQQAHSNAVRNEERARKAAEKRWGGTKAADDAPSDPQAMPGAMLQACSSPSPSEERKKEPASQVATATAQAEFFPPEESQKPPNPKPKPDEDPDKRALWRDGLPVYARITGRDPVEDRSEIASEFRGMTKVAAQDYRRVLDIILAAEQTKPFDAKEWVWAAVRRGPRLVVDNDPNDHWGIEAWCRSLPGVLPTETENDRRRGKWLFAGTVIDYVARRVAEAAQLPPTWRGDWSLLGEWLSAGHDDGDIMEIIAGSVGRVDSITSLRFFDDRVRRTPTENLKYLQKLQRKSA